MFPERNDGFAGLFLELVSVHTCQPSNHPRASLPAAVAADILPRAMPKMCLFLSSGR
jgi:hypothetical protein